MATYTFTEIAPILSEAGIAKSAVETYFSNLPEPPEPKPLPTITKAKIVTIANKYFEDGKMNFENHGGYLGVAQEVGLTSSQVKQIVREIEKCYAIWSAPEPQPEV